MKTGFLFLIIALTAGTTVLAGEVTLQLKLDEETVTRNHKKGTVMFDCWAVVANQTDAPLTFTNLFDKDQGLTLKVTDVNSNEVARLIAAPMQAGAYTIPAAGDMSFSAAYGVLNRFAPGTNTLVHLQLEGKLPGSNYTNKVTSNILEFRIPRS
jgi:hypothetical protein